MGILNAFKRIFFDIVAFRNVESYVVAGAAVALAILGILDDAISLDVKLSVILAALALLVYNITRPEKQRADLDSVLHDRQTFGAFRELVRGRRTLWIYGPSAVNVLRDGPNIKREILDRGGKVRILLQDEHSREGMKILQQQLDKTTDLENSIHMSLDILKNMLAWGNLEYRVLPFSPGFSLVVLDPDKRDGKLIVEFFGFNNEFITDRMHIEIDRQQSQQWFDYWAGQYMKMWDAAYPPADRA